MNNKSVSDFVAATMNAVLESDEHKSLFGNFNKRAQLEGFKVTRHKDLDPNTKCDGIIQGGQCTTCGWVRDKNKAEDSSTDGSSSSSDSNDVKDGSSDKISSAFDIAIDGLLTASAALDSVGFEKSASLSLRIASFVAEAKKKEKEKKSGKKDEKSSEKSSGKGVSNSAKDKKSDKSSSKSTTSSSYSAKKPAPKKDEKKSKK
jgi:hypothetical protein